MKNSDAFHYRQFGNPCNQLTETEATYNRQFHDLSHGRAVKITQLLLIFS
jgi:hypothetical protein